MSQYKFEQSFNKSTIQSINQMSHPAYSGLPFRNDSLATCFIFKYIAFKTNSPFESSKFWFPTTLPSPLDTEPTEKKTEQLWFQVLSCFSALTKTCKSDPESLMSYTGRQKEEMAHNLRH